MKKHITTVTFVRHAASLFRLNDQESRTLTAQGQRDAVRVADVLASHPIVHIYSSHHLRAIETVAVLKERLGCDQTLVPSFAERQLRGADYQPEDFDPREANKYTFSHPYFSYPGGETNAHAQERGISSLLPLLDKHVGEEIIVSTHGILMTLLLRYFDSSFDFDFWIKTTKPDIYTVSFRHYHIVDYTRITFP